MKIRMTPSIPHSNEIPQNEEILIDVTIKILEKCEQTKE